MTRALFPLACLLILACSDRERANPLDPGNPVTHGAPTGFRAAANRNTARLSWDPMEVNGLDMYRIYRTVGDDTLSLYDTVSASSTSCQDFNLKYDSTYTYAIQAVTAWGESRLSPLDTLIPGPYNFQVADFDASLVRRITYDGGHVLDQAYFGSPAAVVGRAGGNRVWVADYYTRMVTCLDADLNELLSVELSGWPVDMALDPTTGDIYLLQRMPDIIQVIDQDGILQAAVPAPDQVDMDGTLAFDAVGGTLWLANPVSYAEGNIYRIKRPVANEEWTYVAQVAHPRQIAADPRGNGCWVATRVGIVRIDSTDSVTTYLSDLRVDDISLNPVSGDCYFTGYLPDENRWQAGRLRESPASSQIILDDAYPWLTGIQVLPGEGQTGFLAAQASTGRILRFDASGNLIGWLGGFGAYVDITLE